ncbi:MAG TPA: VWA domain-containing protein [Pyrinomonadaceae bacterium]|nr:VWA domain-containing protein [Pyrinomonadaceae bacterium]
MTYCAQQSPVGAQVVDLPQPPRWQKSDDTDTVRIETDLVDLNVSVFARDRQQQQRSSSDVGPLQQKDFMVFENGVAEEITFFASASAPLDLVLLLDLSGSTSDKLDLVRKSARRFVEAARPNDRISVVTFTDTARIVAPLMTDHKELISRIKKIEKPRGGTNFWDALRYVLTAVLGNSGGVRRSAVVCMTDGVDNALPDVPGDGSLTSFTALMEVVRRSGSIVLPIYLDTEEEMVLQGRAVAQAYFLARQQLAILAEESGGILYQARRVEDLKGVYEQVISDLSTVYSIGYRPTNRERDGSWRAVNVRLIGRTDLAVRTKRGYYAR